MKDWAARIDGAEVVEVEGPLEQMHLVARGDADALLGYINYPFVTAKYMMSDLAVAFVAERGLDVVIGVNPEYPILQSILDKAIAALDVPFLQSVLLKWTESTREMLYPLHLTTAEQLWLQQHPRVADRKLQPLGGAGPDSAARRQSERYLARPIRPTRQTTRH